MAVESGDLIALVALIAMEIVLGIDNIVFIAILSSRLPVHQQKSARRWGLGAALISRLLLLFSLKWILSWTDPLFLLSDLGLSESWFNGEHGDEILEVSIRDLILLSGGLFLIGKSVHEIHAKLEGVDESHEQPRQVTFTSVLVQIAILDIVFSLDSVITAVGMADQLWVMVVAVVVAIGVMLIFAEKVSAFVEKHPTVKMLALSFLILIGVVLVSEGLGTHFNKGYIYFSMAFALVVEFLNMRMRNRTVMKIGRERKA